MRKDASNNNANKISTKIAAESSMLELFHESGNDHKPLTLGSSQQRAKTALLRAQQKLQLLDAANAAANAATTNATTDNAATSTNEIDPPIKSSPPATTPAPAKCGASDCPKNNSSETNSDQKLLNCSACRSQSYCSSDCQRRDWPNHKVQCKLTLALKKLSVSNNADPATVK